MDKCSYHDDLMNQVFELSRQISDLKTTLVRVIIASLSAASGVISAMQVILCT